MVEEFSIKLRRIRRQRPETKNMALIYDALYDLDISDLASVQRLNEAMNPIGFTVFSLLNKMGVIEWLFPSKEPEQNYKNFLVEILYRSEAIACDFNFKLPEWLQSLYRLPLAENLVRLCTGPRSELPF